MSVYFGDCNGKVHAVPQNMTHFDPNKHSDPYVVSKLAVTYESGRSVDFPVCERYFDAFAYFADETAPTYTGGLFVHRDLELAEFVRFIGTRDAVRAIVNHMVEYSTATVMPYTAPSFLIFRHFHTFEAPVSIQYSANACIIHDGAHVRKYSGDGQGWLHPQGGVRTPLLTHYADDVLKIIDECMHLRDIIEFVKGTSNEVYASRLRMVQDGINKVMTDINPAGELFAMCWLLPVFHKIPTCVRCFWKHAIVLRGLNFYEYCARVRRD